MATKSKSTEIAKPAYEATKWINHTLTVDEKEQHDAAKPKAQDLLKDYVTLAVQGYNLSLKWDSYSRCFQASLLPWAKENPNYGYGLSARSPEPLRAISLLLFKHYQVLSENWVEFYKAPISSLEG